MKTSRNILSISLKTFATALLGLTLFSCDIEPISVGDWEVSIQIEEKTHTSTWRITREAINIYAPIANKDIFIEEVDLSGSRISWSTEAENIPILNIRDRINFNGTVDGNQLAGTLFSQQGNYSVNGKRLTDSITQ